MGKRQEIEARKKQILNQIIIGKSVREIAIDLKISWRQCMRDISELKEEMTSDKSKYALQIKGIIEVILKKAMYLAQTSESPVQALTALLRAYESYRDSLSLLGLLTPVEEKSDKDEYIKIGQLSGKLEFERLMSLPVEKQYLELQKMKSEQNKSSLKIPEMVGIHVGMNEEISKIPMQQVMEIVDAVGTEEPSEHISQERSDKSIKKKKDDEYEEEKPAPHIYLPGQEYQEGKNWEKAVWQMSET